MKFLKIFTALLITFSFLGLTPDEVKHPFQVTDTTWTDSVLNSLSLDQKIGQLFMVAAYSKKGKGHQDAISKLIKEQQIGGLIFMQGGPIRQANQTNLYQSQANVPLMLAIDGEWGLAMRLDSTVRYPRQMLMGAIQDNSLIYDMGKDVAEQCKRIGLHVNFAPVVDVNNNANNPVINSRSFGEDKENVARKGVAYMKGMQDNGIMANAKHFPGHGDTDTDSHKALPVIRHNKERLNNIELYPFRELIKAGIGSMMVAHLYIPALDSTKNVASTLSPKVVTKLLKEDMQFNGLIFTDALNMKGVSSYYKPGEVDLKALLAGNDVLLFAEDVPVAISKIKEAITQGLISEEEITKRCRKILMAKQWCGLDKLQKVETKDLYKDLNKTDYDVTKRKLYQNAMTLVHDKRSIIPLKRLDTLRIASVAFGNNSPNSFQKTMSNYTKVTHFNLPKDPSQSQKTKLLSDLKNFNLIVVSYHNTSRNPKGNFGISTSSIKFTKEIAKTKKVILDVFANPYSLNKMYGIEGFEAIIVSYDDSYLANFYSAQLIFGGIAAKGKLPVTASPTFTVGQGVETTVGRFQYAIPEELGIKSSDLDRIDAIVKHGMDEQAYPGCQVLVAKEGKIIYNKSFGYYTYEHKKPVTDSSIYDLASITKISSSLLSVMSLQDVGKFNLNDKLGDYLSDLVDSSEYKDMVLRDILAHQAGLVSWIPFYAKTLHKGQPRYDLYSMDSSVTYSVKVAEKFYIHHAYKDTMYARIIRTPLRAEKTYKYSDLGYYFMMKIVEQQTGVSLDRYTQENFYKKLGATTMGYQPLERFPKEQIVPTEYDMTFRKQLIQGYVHDPGSAMMGGVGGHAGNFSNATDLAKLMQMYLNWGEYGGERYLQENTVKEFAKCQYCGTGNRRGAGFDKPAPHGQPGPTCDCISFESFGHSGFTGTLTWADPEEQIVYVFLSNRVYPDAGNRKLIKMGTRTQIMRAIYDALYPNRVVAKTPSDSDSSVITN